jgi:hypothetical protein
MRLTEPPTIRRAEHVGQQSVGSTVPVPPFNDRPESVCGRPTIIGSAVRPVSDSRTCLDRRGIDLMTLRLALTG